jgi:hypothetical protein
MVAQFLDIKNDFKSLHMIIMISGKIPMISDLAYLCEQPVICFTIPLFSMFVLA